MAIAIGTTQRQLQAAARWLLLCVVVVGMLGWWQPGYRTWGAMTAGVLAVWTLWLCRRINIGDRGVTLNPAHAAWIVPVAVVIYQSAVAPVIGVSGGRGLSGALNMSLVFHVWLLATATMLCQELFAGPGCRLPATMICGAAMMAGPVVAMAMGPAVGDDGARSLGFVAMAGVALWLAALWPPAGADGPLAGERVTGERVTGERRDGAIRSMPARLAIIGVAVLAVGLLARLAPLAAAMSIAVVAAAMGVAAGRHPRRRIVLLAVAGLLGAAAIGAMWATGFMTALTKLTQPGHMLGAVVSVGLLGQGEQAYVDLPTNASGMATLIGLVGWGPTAWLVGVLVAAMAWTLLGGGKGVSSGDDASRLGRSIVWTVAAGLSAGALLSARGLNAPSATLAAAVTWSLLPATTTTGRWRRFGGLAVALALLGMLLVLGLSKLVGLASWISSAAGLEDWGMHVFAGFSLTLVFAWLAGANRLRWGVAAILLVALAGGGGELMQAAFSARTASISDWMAHVAGCAAATPLYLLAMGARWCESPDVRPS